jgi:predicted ArsR family transcriptional regulator
MSSSQSDAATTRAAVLGAVPKGRWNDGVFVTTREVAEDAGCSMTTARRHLKALREAGEVQAKEKGAMWLWLQEADADE